MRMNSLIPMGVRPVDMTNSLASGFELGNALMNAPLERKLLEARARQLEAEANAFDKFGMDPYQAASIANDERRIRLAEVEAAKPDVPSSVEEFNFAQNNPEYAAFLAAKTPMTEGQGRAGTFTDRMVASHKVLTDNEGTIGKHPIQAGAEEVLGGWANPMLSGEMQMTLQAQRDFINAVLRRESGATISPSEFENARKQYFPQIGDGPEVIAQKRQNRIITMKGMAREAGPRYQAPEMYDPPANAAPSAPAPAGTVDAGMMGGGSPNPPLSVAPPTTPGELPVYNSQPDPRGALYPEPGQPQGMNMRAAPEGTIISNGQKRLIKRAGQWVPI